MTTLRDVLSELAQAILGIRADQNAGGTTTATDLKIDSAMNAINAHLAADEAKESADISSLLDRIEALEEAKADGVATDSIIAGLRARIEALETAGSDVDALLKGTPTDGSAPVVFHTQDGDGAMSLGNTGTVAAIGAGGITVTTGNLGGFGAIKVTDTVGIIGVDPGGPGVVSVTTSGAGSFPQADTGSATASGGDISVGNISAASGGGDPGPLDGQTASGGSTSDTSAPSDSGADPSPQSTSDSADQPGAATDGGPTYTGNG